MKLPLNKIIHMDCIDLIKKLPEDSIDLIVFSPPYFNSRKKYQRGSGVHYTADVGEPLYVIEDIFREAIRIVKEDGFLCINLGFSYGETGIFRPFYIVQRALMFGWFGVDLIIWKKDNPIPLKGRLTNAFEYIFVLAKHPHNKYPNHEELSYELNILETVLKNKKASVIETSINKPKDASFHSAVFPKEVPAFCIEHFSKMGDVVFDPMMGSGTTALASIDLQRYFIGCDINKEYVKKATYRIKKYKKKPFDGNVKEKKSGLGTYF